MGKSIKNVSMFAYNEDHYLELTCDDPSSGLRGVEQVGGGGGEDEAESCGKVGCENFSIAA